MVTELVTTVEHRETYVDEGTFLPEGVLLQRGFDVARIKANIAAADIMEDRLLGTCYRVALRTTGNSGSRVTKQSQALRQSAKRPKTMPVEPAEPLAIEDGEVAAPEDESDSSSTTDSSSSSHRHRKKHSKKSKKHTKKDKNDEKPSAKKGLSVAEKKAMEALEKTQQQEKDKAANMNIKLARQLLTKLATVIESLGVLLENDDESMVGEPVKSPVSMSLERLSELAGRCRAIIKRGGTGDVSLPSLKDVQADIAAAKRHMSLMGTVLATFAKARRG